MNNTNKSSSRSQTNTMNVFLWTSLEKNKCKYAYLKRVEMIVIKNRFATQTWFFSNSPRPVTFQILHCKFSVEIFLISSYESESPSLPNHQDYKNVMWLMWLVNKAIWNDLMMKSYDIDKLTIIFFSRFTFSSYSRKKIDKLVWLTLSSYYIPLCFFFLIILQIEKKNSMLPKKDISFFRSG